jgi:hypothetical protein
MKDAQPFDDISLGLVQIDLGRGRSSLAVTDVVDSLLNNPVMEKPGRNAHDVTDVLHSFGQEGATHRDLKSKYLAKHGGSPSTFDRALSELKEGREFRTEGKGQGKRYFPVPAASADGGVSVKPVSKDCHDTPQAVSVSPPSLGGDTDTKALG